MAFGSMRTDAIVKQTFEVFSGHAGLMTETEFADFCETSRGVCVESAKKIFLIVTANPDKGMRFKEFEEALGRLIDLCKSSSRTSDESSAKNDTTAAKATSRGSITAPRENRQQTPMPRHLQPPRGVLCESNKLESLPSPVAKTPVDAAEKMVKALRVPRCTLSRRGLGEGSQALLSLKKQSRCSVSSVSSASTASGSDRSDTSSVSSSPLVSPKASPHSSARSSPRLSTRTTFPMSRLSQTVR